MTTNDTYDTLSLSGIPILPPLTTLGEVEENMRELATALMRMHAHRSNINAEQRNTKLQQVCQYYLQCQHLCRKHQLCHAQHSTHHHQITILAQLLIPRHIKHQQ